MVHNECICVINCLIIVIKLASTYFISGFNDYVIEDKILYRKAYKIKMSNGNFQYRQKRKIERIFNNGIEGYMLSKNGKRKFKTI